MHSAAVCACFLLGFVSVAHISGEENVYVRAPAGEIVGHYKNLTRSGQQYWYSSFLSIPYAETTAGENRFRKPVKKGTFQSPYVASGLKPACYQNSFLPPGMRPAMSEDCLHLSVIVPGNVSNANSLAVMIWIHGGGFQYRSQNAFVSPSFAVQNDVIAVFINYRVSALGFLANHKSLRGNYGLWDQHMAIHWVRDNIAAFGGDTDRITLFGVSAGAISVVYQGLYKGNQKLVTGLIVQSGAVNTIAAAVNPTPTPTENYDALVEKTACKSKAEEIEMAESELECLRNISSGEFQSYVQGMSFFQPTIDGEFVTISPKTVFIDSSPVATRLQEYFGDLNIIMGVSKHDGVIVVPNFGQGYQGITVDEFESNFVRDISFMTGSPSKLVTTAVVNDYINWTNPENKVMNGLHYYDMLKDLLFAVPQTLTARAHARANGQGKIYAYEFQHKPSYSKMADWLDGAIHADDTMFVLGFPGMDVALLPTDEVELSMNMMKYWTQFAKTGNPYNPADVTSQVWPEYTPTDQKYIIFESNMTSFPVKERMRAKYVHLWDVLVPAIMELETDSTSCKNQLTSGSPGHYQNGFSMLIVLVVACLVS